MNRLMVTLKITRDLKSERSARYAAWIAVGDGVFFGSGDEVMIALEATETDVRRSAREVLSGLAARVDAASVEEAEE